MIYDAHQRFVRSGLKAYLRIRNFLEKEADGTSSDYLEVGIPFTPTGVAGAAVGFQDILIDPPAGSEETSARDMSNMPTVRFNMGSRTFFVSQTFVLAQMNEFDLEDPYAVFRDRDGYKTVGIFYNSRLYSIEGISPREAAGEIVSWKLVCNAPETQNV